LKYTPGYNAAKAAEIAGYLVEKCGGEVSKLKLAKLMYLVEREAARQWGHFMFFDRHRSAAHGPIGSHSLDGINGKEEPERWNAFVRTKDTRTVVNPPEYRPGNYSHTSESDREIADAVIDQFGQMSAAEIRNYTHDLPEYLSVKGGKGSHAITPQEIAKAIGADPDDFADTDEELRSLADWLSRG
jgi:uncharacterized phage-associated protein